MLILFIIYFLKYALLNQINLFFFIIYSIFLYIFIKKVNLFFIIYVNFIYYLFFEICFT